MYKRQVLGYCVGGLLPVACFLRGGEKELRLVPTALYPKALWDACINGSSELMSNISASVVGILYNIQLMRLVGEMGVAAYSVMMYVDFIFIAVFLGYSIGCAQMCIRDSIWWILPRYHWSSTKKSHG